MIQWPSIVIDDIARRRAVLFLGAGVSKNSLGVDGITRPPSWVEFLDAGLLKCTGRTKHIKNLIRDGDLLTACEIIKDKLEEDWFELLREKFIVPQYRPSPLHDSLFRLDLRLVFTYNFDKIYDTYAQATSNNTVQSKNYYDIDLSRVLRGDNRAIVKVHGTIDEPSQMIFTRKEYIQARHKNHTFYSILDALTITHTFIFVGCGLSDPDVQLFLERYAQSYPSSRPHYIVMPKGLHKDIISSVRRNMNLHILEYNPAAGHKELADSAGELVTLVDARRLELAGSQDW